MAFDAAGNLFVVPAQDHKVRKMTPGGAWSTVAGSGTYGFAGERGAATAAELALIGFGMGGDVAVDHNGTLFIGGFQRIWKVDGVAAPVRGPAQPPTTMSTTTSTTVPGRTSADGATSAWGWNYYGRLGNGTTTTATAPVPVGLGRAAAVSAGAIHKLAAGVRP